MPIKKFPDEAIQVLVKAFDTVLLSELDAGQVLVSTGVLNGLSLERWDEAVRTARFEGRDLHFNQTVQLDAPVNKIRIRLQI